MSRVALVLGSGGARGYAHIGVIDELHARGHEVVGVSGSSMGALVGGLCAAGALDEYAAWARKLGQRDVLRLLDPVLTGPGMIRAQKIFDVVHDLIADVAIEELPIPFTAVATDLGSGRSVWFQRGRLEDAIRASIAIPGVFAPHEIDGRLLADGGILNPLPLAPMHAVAADLTVAVDLGGTRDDSDAVTKLNQLEVMNRSLDLMMAALTRHELATYPPDVLIVVPRSAARSLDFHRAEETIALGRDLAARALDES